MNLEELKQRRDELVQDNAWMDNLIKEKEEELVEKYKMQLSLYSKALSKSMKKEVTNKFIYSTKFNKLIKITEE